MKKISSLLIFFTLLIFTIFSFPNNTFAYNVLSVTVDPHPTSATFKITPGSGSGGVSHICYSVTGSSDDKNVTTPYLTGGATSSVLVKGLTPATGYTAVVDITCSWTLSGGVNVESNATTSDEDSFTTPDISATLTSSSVSQTGAKVTATFTPAPDFTNPPTVYYIATTTEPSDIDITGNAKSFATTCTGAVCTANLSGLDANTQYYYKLYATELASSTVDKMGGIQTFTTTAAAVEGVPNITDNKGDSVKVNFKSSIAFDPSPYVAYYGTSSVVTEILGTSPMSATDKINFSTTLTGLATGTTYYYFVKDTTSGGGMYPTSTDTFVTADTSTGGTSGGGGNGGGNGGGSGSGGKNVTMADFNGGLVNCGTTSQTQKCNFDYLIKMINKMILFLIWIIAPCIMAGAIAYGGYEYLTSAGGEGKEKGKKFMLNAFYGWLIAMAAWIIVKFLMQALGYNQGKVTDFPTFWPT